MANLRLAFRDDNAGQKLSRSMNSHAAQVRSALLASAEDAREEILLRGRDDIAGAGRFGSRWTRGLKADVENENDGDILLNVHHDVTYFMIHQKGGTIHGNPELAIPLSFSDAVGIRARNYPGGLFRVNRKSGSPLLLAFSDKKPKYVLKKSVFIPKRFHVIEIVREVSKKLRQFYAANFRG